MGKTKIKKIEEIEEVKTNTIPEMSEDARRETELAGPQTKDEKKSKKPKKGQPKIRSKKYQEVLEKIDKNQKLAANLAVEATQKGSYSKFEGTIEAHINTNAKNLRGLVNLPFAQGKKLRILAFGTNADKSGADIIGSEEAIGEIEKGKINFDIVVTTPEWMPKLAKIAKILGPKSLMPNPKNGTITENLEKAVTELQAGKTEYKTENNGQVIHLSVGKSNQNPEEIVANLKVIYNTVGRSKIKKIFLSPTMGPSVKVDLSTLN